MGDAAGEIKARRGERCVYASRDFATVRPFSARIRSLDVGRGDTSRKKSIR